jgi:hypothetical protein
VFIVINKVIKHNFNISLPIGPGIIPESGEESVDILNSYRRTRTEARTAGSQDVASVRK